MPASRNHPTMSRTKLRSPVCAFHRDQSARRTCGCSACPMRSLQLFNASKRRRAVTSMAGYGR